MSEQSKHDSARISALITDLRDARARIVELTRERDEARAESERLRAVALEAARVTSEIPTLRDAVRRLRRFVGSRGAHSDGCAKKWAAANKIDAPCDCGLDMLLRDTAPLVEREATEPVPTVESRDFTAGYAAGIKAAAGAAWHSSAMALHKKIMALLPLVEREGDR